MAHNYQKIYAPYGRVSPNDRHVDPTIYYSDWVQYFEENNIPMYASEKIDGTSIGIKWDGERVSFIGHTDKSQINPQYLEYLNNRFGTPEFESMLEQIFGDKPIILYGEGVSNKYNCDYGFPNGEFIFYDVQKEDGRFYNRDFVKAIGDKLQLKMPHEEFGWSIKDCIEKLRTIKHSYFGENYKLEGFVLRPFTELYTNDGKRVICKIKMKDFWS